MLNKLGLILVLTSFLFGCKNSDKETIEKESNNKDVINTSNGTKESEFNLNSNFKFTPEEKLLLDKFHSKLNSIKEREILEEYINQYISLGLKLDTTIKYELSFYVENLNNDHEEDVVITLNLLNFARKKAAKAQNSAQLAQIGFMGDYNYVLFLDGATKKITNETVIRSTPLAPLKVSFENISSLKYKDILIDFRILNASYKDFYTIKNNRLERIFQWKNFDGLGNDINEAYYFEFGTGTLSTTKDILVFNAKLQNPKVAYDKFTYEPKIEKTDKIFKRFFYHPETGIYMTR